MAHPFRHPHRLRFLRDLFRGFPLRCNPRLLRNITSVPMPSVSTRSRDSRNERVRPEFQAHLLIFGSPRAGMQRPVGAGFVPTGQGISAQGKALGIQRPRFPRSEGTPHLAAWRTCVPSTPIRRSFRTRTIHHFRSWGCTGRRSGRVRWSLRQGHVFDGS